MPLMPPPPEAGVLDPRIVETHTAVLFFLGDHVYKLKKAVDLGFLDQSRREDREALCHQEVDLNRRLAPDVYLGVVDLVDDQGTVVDHLVDMRRMPEDRRLSRCIERGEQVDDALRYIARAVTALHLRTPPDPVHDRRATLTAVWERWTAGFDQLRSLELDEPTAAAMTEMERLVDRYLAGRSALFDQRIAEGWIRDGHGDLQAEDVFLLDDGPRILDCIEFGDEYRWGDVLADVAFLAMDLERLGRPDLADDFLLLHRELSGDRWPATLADHDVAYRAHVRAKVGVVRAVQRAEPSGAGVQPYVDLALDHLRRAQVQVVLVGGTPGTGKSTLAEALGDRLGAVVLRTDEVRQRCDLGTGLDRYSPEAVTATYLETLLEARRLVGLGEHVILDATWGSALHRSLARAMASDTSCELTELRCTLPRAEADARIQRRRAAGGDPSEATVAVAAMLEARFDAWPEATEISTHGTPGTVADHAAGIVQGRAGRAR